MPSRCHNIGINGGCGVSCEVFVEGGCDVVDEQQDSSELWQELCDEHGEEDAKEIAGQYECLANIIPVELRDES